MVVKKSKQLVFPKNQSKPKNDNQIIKVANKENTMIIDQIEDDKSYIEKDQVYMEPKVKSKTTQPKKKQYAFNDSRVHSKIINKACSTNFVIKNIRNVKGTMYNRQF